MKFLRRESLVERLARESGWRVLVNEGDYFEVRNPASHSMFDVSVRCRDTSDFMDFWSVFQVRFALRHLATDFLLGVLVRNHKLQFGQWCIAFADSCEANLVLSYSAIKSGVTKRAFHFICQDMVDERLALSRLLRDQFAEMGRAASPAPPSLRPLAHGNSLVPRGSQGITWLDRAT